MPELLTAEQKLERLTQILDEYESLNGLPRFQNQEISEEINRYITMSVMDMEKLHPTDCANIAARLAQQSFHLQRLYNREKSVVTSMTVALDKCIAQQIKNYNTFLKYELNVAAIVNENEYAKTLQNIIVKATQRMNRLYGLSEKLQQISDGYLNIQRAKISMTRTTG